MITFVRTTPFPKCKYCGVQMTYYIFGLDDDKHYHPDCFAKACVTEAFERLEK